MDNKKKSVHGTDETKNKDLTVRVSICELEIKNLKYQLQFLCKPFMEKQKKPSPLKSLTMDELLKAGQKKEHVPKTLSAKIVGKVSRLIRGNKVLLLF